MKLFRMINNSLKWKLIVFISTIVLFTASSIALFSYYEMSRTIQHDIERFSTQILLQANLNLSRYYREYEQGFIMMSGSREFDNWFRAQPGDIFEITQSFNQMTERYFNPFAKEHPEILSITLYNKLGFENRFLNPKSDLYLRLDYSMSNEVWLEEITFTEGIQRFVKQSENYIEREGMLRTIPVMTLIKEFQINGIQGYLKMDVSLANTLEILGKIHLGEQGIGIIIDQNGQIVAHPEVGKVAEQLNQELVQQIGNTGSGSFFNSASHEMVVYETIPLTSWKTLVMVPYKDVARSIFRVKSIMIIITLTSLIVSIILVVALSSSITKRLQRLRAAMKQTELGNFKVRAEVNGEDEFAILSRNYNAMLESLEASVLQLTESRLLQQEAAMSALQSQIHSHFLYNALESINAMANLANRPEIGQTTIALSNMLRYTSNYRETTVSLKDEINHLNDYIHIIQVLYGDAVNLDYDIPEECAEASCLKAIIQPLVENSVKHGLEQSGETLYMKLSAAITDDGYINVQIVDNGGGFAEETLNTLSILLTAEQPQYKYKQLSRVGILNVHYRLKMYYPDSNSGVSIKNDLRNYGAKVQIIFPYKRIKQEGGII